LNNNALRKILVEREHGFREWVFMMGRNTQR